MKQLLSPEEVAALFQGLREADAEYRPGSEFLLSKPRLPQGLCEWRPSGYFRKISHWLTKLIQLQWPQL